MSREDIHLKRTTIPAADTLRVASLNLLNQPGNLQARLANLAAEVRALDLDVLCLQEVLAEADPMVADYLTQHTQLAHTHAAEPKWKAGGASYGTLTLTRKPLTCHEQMTYAGIDARGSAIIPATIVGIEHNGRTVHIINVHLAWGSQAEPVRMRQAELLNFWTERKRAADPDAIVLMLGDFNAEENNSVMRFLRGQQASALDFGTLWVDAWQMHGAPDNRITSEPETYWGEQTGARKSSLYNLDLIPKRRIDYILAYDWCYGKAGSPLTFQRFADTLTGDAKEISDHFGICSDIYVPRVP
jgi:endonuclease/exonuclease/phosphatase family metal-dependent hydrolase